ncbi:unnamed protein product [Blepharisma stoltei]|uniref:Uncharacterized protein n=1 Tax=Blepharisma stoltei TaxID=1481888 RepID=A0AAU9JUV1_9CILI|nr:unnamed protein product [Blepharisma stoltei]
MISDKCDIEGCKNDANFMCTCANPETFLCSDHINKHLQGSPGPHHAIEFNTEKRVRTKSENINYLTKQTEKLKKLKKSLYKEISLKIIMIEKSLHSCTTKIDREIFRINLKIKELIVSDDTNLNVSLKSTERRWSFNDEKLDKEPFEVNLPSRKSSADSSLLERRGSVSSTINETIGVINSNALQALMRDINLFMRSAERIKIHDISDSPSSSHTFEESPSPNLETHKKKNKLDLEILQNKSELPIKTEENNEDKQKMSQNPILLKEPETAIYDYLASKSKPLKSYYFKNPSRTDTINPQTTEIKIEIRESLECCNCGGIFDSSAVIENFCGCLTCTKCNILEVKKFDHMQGYFVNVVCRVCKRMRQITGHRL